MGELALRWGVQVDVRSLHADGGGPDDDAVAAYVAKYVTKGASETGAGLNHRVTTWDDIDTAPVNDHVRALMRACWFLGGLTEFESLRLRAWAHTLGYRGHIFTKSRSYSTTYAALRAERAHHVGHLDVPNTTTERPGATSARATPLAQLLSLPESPKTWPRTARLPAKCARCPDDWSAQ